ncbi:MAG: LysM domain-containing protein [Candidatus Falkowbacteria bacterium]
MKQVRNLTGLFSVLLLVFFAQTSLAVEYSGIGGRPAYPQADNKRTESIFVHTVTPGEEVKEGVKIINNSGVKKSILVYATDSEVASGGNFTCAQKADQKVEAGDWIKLDKSVVTLESTESEIIPFKILVPKNASVGEHNACIVIQENKNTPDKTEGGIQISFRTGLRVALLVPGEIKRNLEIVKYELRKNQGNSVIVLHPEVKNTGNVSIDTSIKTLTKNILGQIINENGGQYPILRDQTSEWNFELNRPFWGGWYKTTLKVEYDANPEATVGKPSGKTITSLAGPVIWFYSAPSTKALGIEIVLLGILIAVIFLAIRAQLNRRKIKNTWVMYEVLDEDDLSSIAERHHINWKLLAKTNHLEAPFLIKPGQKLRVPPQQQ